MSVIYLMPRSLNRTHPPVIRRGHLSPGVAFVPAPGVVMRCFSERQLPDLEAGEVPSVMVELHREGRRSVFFVSSRNVYRPVVIGDRLLRFAGVEFNKTGGLEALHVELLEQFETIHAIA